MNEYTIGKRILETLTSSLYYDPIVMFREYVQNSLDSKIKNNIPLDDFVVDIKVNIKEKIITITDNGSAINNASFGDVMKSFSNSEKTNEEVGYRGIGRLSALPFCDELTFKSKAIDSKTVNVCIWNSKKYREFMDDSTRKDLKSVLDEIVLFREESTTDSKSFFSVIIKNYSDEIEKIIHDDKFESKLKKLLPLRYDPTFTKSEKILTTYQEVVGSSMEKYMCNVKLNGVELYKEYKNDMIGAIGIQTMKINIKISGQMKTVGFIWHTFDQKVEVKKEWKKFGIEGIYVRSKNFQMGSNTVIANKLDGIANITFSEMYATLRGVSGELLLCTDALVDNAGRDWFKPSAELSSFTGVLNQYIILLKRYRYQSSKYYRILEKQGSNEEDILREKNKTKNALNDLLGTSLDDAEDLVSEYVAIPKNLESKPKSEKDTVPPDHSSNTNLLYSEQDIPDRPTDVKKFYDSIMKIVEKHLRSGNKYTLFDKIRFEIRAELDDETKNEDSTGGT